MERQADPGRADADPAKGTVPAQPGPGNAADRERQGGLLFGDKKYAEAEAMYRAATALDPENARYHNDLATALFAQRGFEAAEAAQRAALRLDSGNAEYHDNLGEYLLAQGRYVAAEEAYRAAISLDPGNPAYLNDLGRSLFPQRRYGEAEDVQRKAIDIVNDPTGKRAVDVRLLSQFYNNLGDALFNQGCGQEAEDAYREACRLDPDNARNRNDFGATLFVLRKYAEAEAELTAAVRLDPGTALFQNNLGDTLFALERYPEAESACRKAVELAADQDKYHHDLGTTLFMQRKYAAAESEYQRARQLQPGDARYRNSLGLCLLAQRRYAEAEQAVREAAGLDPGNREYRYNLASILASHARDASQHDRFAEAEEALREAVRECPEDARYHSDLAAVLLAARRYADAEAEQQEAVRLDPGMASYHNDLGAILVAQARYGDQDGSVADAGEPGNPEAHALDLYRRAEGAFAAAVRLDPSNAGSQNSLSAAFFAQKKYKEAEAALRAALRLDDRNHSYRSNLAHTLFAQQRYHEAEQAYRDTIRLDEGNSRHYDGLGTSLFAQREFAGAEAAYRMAIRLSGTPALTVFFESRLAAALTVQGQYEDAVTVLKHALGSDPGNADCHDSLASVLYQLRSYDDAEREERVALTLASSPAQTGAFKINLARILVHQARLAEAAQELAAFDELETRNAAVHGILGTILERQGEMERAEAKYRHSLAIEDSISVRCNLAILLARNNRFDEAAEKSYQALQAAPESWMPHYALALLALEQADEYHDNSYYDDAVQHLRRAMAEMTAHTPPSVQADIRAILHLNLGYAYGKLGRGSRALAEFRECKQVSRIHSRTWFTADANIRRYRRGRQAATSQRTQTAVFMTLGFAVIVSIVLLEWKDKLTSPYLVTLLAVVMALFVIAFYLPIITSIKLGPVSLDKQAIGLRTEPPEPIPSTENSLDASLEEWADEEITRTIWRNRVSFAIPPPSATEPKPTPQETPPLPQPFGARPAGPSA